MSPSVGCSPSGDICPEMATPSVLGFQCRWGVHFAFFLWLVSGCFFGYFQYFLLLINLSVFFLWLVIFFSVFFG